MPTIGDSAVFAIEWHLLWRYNDWIFGNICFGAAGEQIGDAQESVILSVCVSYLRQFLFLFFAKAPRFP